jgi:hypothetical protein
VLAKNVAKHMPEIPPPQEHLLLEVKEWDSKGDKEWDFVWGPDTSPKAFSLPAHLICSTTLGNMLYQ